MTPGRVPATATPTLRQALPTWIKVACLSFGGPAGQIAVMQRLLVDERRWISERRFLHALNYCMLLPGPEATQLAAYIGWLMHRWRGGLAAGAIFVLPGFVSILVLSVVYAGWGDVPLVEAVFYGIKPAVLAIVLQALLTIARRALVSGYLLAIAAAAFIAIFVFGVPFPAIIVASALAGWIGARLGIEGRISLPGADDPSEPEPVPPPPIHRTAATAALWLALWWAPVGLLALTAGGSVFLDEAVFFSQTASVTFGGAYAVLAYVTQRAVADFGWLTPGEMLDGLGMAETTPGPLIQVVQFVGFLGAYRDPGSLHPMVAGALGSFVTAWVTFVPCFLFIFVGAPYVEHLRGREDLNAALSGITAAVVGVILNLALWFSVRTLFDATEPFAPGAIDLELPVWSTVDPMAMVIALGAGIALLGFRRGILETIVASAALGAAVRLL